MTKLLTYSIMGGTLLTFAMLGIIVGFSIWSNNLIGLSITFPNILHDILAHAIVIGVIWLASMLLLYSLREYYAIKR